MICVFLSLSLFGHGFVCCVCVCVFCVLVCLCERFYLFPELILLLFFLMRLSLRMSDGYGFSLFFLFGDLESFFYVFIYTFLFF